MDRPALAKKGKSGVVAATLALTLSLCLVLRPHQLSVTHAQEFMQNADVVCPYVALGKEESASLKTNCFCSGRTIVCQESHAVCLPPMPICVSSGPAQDK